jgi:hypothetical protein
MKRTPRRRWHRAIALLALPTAGCVTDAELVDAEQPRPLMAAPEPADASAPPADAATDQDAGDDDCNDHNSCTFDYASRGQCVHAPRPSGAPCFNSSGRLGRCEGGICTRDCWVTDECGMVPSTQCFMAPRCESGRCSPGRPLNEGRACTHAGRSGTCRNGTCTTACNISADCAVPPEPCWTSICTGGQCSPRIMASNEACNHGTGHCVGGSCIPNSPDYTPPN